MQLAERLLAVRTEFRLISTLKRFTLRHKSSRKKRLKVRTIGAVIESAMLNGPHVYGGSGGVKYGSDVHAEKGPKMSDESVLMDGHGYAHGGPHQGSVVVSHSR